MKFTLINLKKPVFYLRNYPSFILFLNVLCKIPMVDIHYKEISKHRLKIQDRPWVIILNPYVQQSKHNG